MPEVVVYEKVATEDLELICAGCDEKYTIEKVPVYHNCRVKYEDGTEHAWKKFYALDEKSAKCPKCAKK